MICMGLRIKNCQYDQLVSLISFATCDEDCKDCPWQNNERYNCAEYACLLMELKDNLPDDKVEQELDYKVDYLRNKKKQE